MGYFNYLQNINYRDENGNYSIANNILTRGKILDTIKQSQSGYLEYTIRDEERPETIAQRVYGRSDYHWIILLFNEILDPYFNWPMSMHEVEKHMEGIYGGKALIIYPNRLWDNDKRTLLDRRNPHFQVGDTIQQKDKNGVVFATATVKSWNPNLYKIVIENIEGVFALQGEASIRPSVIGDPELLSLDIHTINSNGKAISVPLVRLTDDNRYALHHFENDNEETISPLYRPTSRDAEGGRHESPSAIIDSYSLGRVEIMDLGVDEDNVVLGYANMITNISYEEKVNDAKRNIRVMKPQFIDPLLRDFRKLFRS